MKYHSILLVIAAVFAVASSHAADNLDQAVKKLVAGANVTAPPVLPPVSIFSHAILSEDNKVLLSGWDGALRAPSDNPFSQTKYHLLTFDDPSTIHTVTYPPATGRVELIKISAKAATATLTATELYGGVFTNTGASGSIVLTLPAPVLGMHFRVYLTVAQDVDINAAASTQILVLTNATGDAISSAATIGNSIELVALSTTTWAAFAVSGTWTDVN